jgi:class 3 adenylate cyclase/pimeloyl-ACP methyl ester carboxylesterase
MMEREVRYCKSEDGVRIAYWVDGAGPPFVYISEPLLTSSEGDYRLPTTARWYAQLAERRTVIRFDPRGTGLSGPSDDFSIDALRRDLAAVVESNALDTFDLWGDLDGGIVAAAYAASNSARVAHLVLWNTFARGTDVPQSETLQTLDRLISLDWPLFTRTAVTMFGEWQPGEAMEYARYMERACDPATGRRFIDTTWLYDIENLLCQITCPTLVLHRRDQQYFPPALGQHLAASIPDARLVLVEGFGFFPWFEQSDTVLAHFDNFTGASRPRANAVPPSSSDRGHAGTAIILFADIVDSTALTERLGDAAFREKARGLDGALRNIIRDKAGTPIEGKLLGDGVVAVFSSARQAIEAALACARSGNDAGLPLHLGLHAGDVIREDNNVYGGAVNIASRISGLSAPCEVLVSETVRSLARTSAGVRFEDRGEQALKGVGEPVRVWAARE